MSDLTFLDMPIEVLAERPRLDMLLTRLRAEGFRPFAAEVGKISNSLDALLVDAKSLSPAVQTALSDASLSHIDRLLVVLGGAPAQDTDHAIALDQDSDLKQLKLRILNRRRRQLIEAESALRLDTAQSMERTIAVKPRTDALSTLYLGDGSAAFLSLSATLRDHGIGCTPALTLGTAMDFVASSRFDGVIASVGHDDTRIQAWLDFVDADPNLGGVPLIIHNMSGELLDAPLAEYAARRGAVVIDGASTETHGLRLADIIRKQAAATPLTAEQVSSDAIVDKGTDVFNRTFFGQHLAGQIDFAERTEWPLSLLTLRLRGYDDNLVGGVKALSAVSTVMRQSLRAVDVPARLDRHTLAVSLLGTGYAGAVDLSNRLKTALTRDPATQSIQRDLFWRAVERRRYHTADLLIGSSLVGPFVSMDIAA